MGENTYAIWGCIIKAAYPQAKDCYNTAFYASKDDSAVWPPGAPFEEAFDVIEKIQQEVTGRIFYIKPVHLVSLKMCKEIRVL